MKDKNIDWNEHPLQRWLGSITNKGTKSIYKSGYRFYAQYTGLTATQLIDEALEDVKKDPREKTDIVKQRLIGFYNWLEKEAPKRKTRGRGITELVAKGVAPKMAHTYVNALRGFYGTFDVYVKLKGRSKLPKPRVLNKRMLVSNIDVRKLLDNARTIQDRAMILVMFQGGMDISTLCSLKYGDVAEGLAKNEHPLKLELFRGKAGVEHYTFLGKDAVEGLKAYLNDVKARGLTLTYNSPLFLKGSYKAKTYEGIEPYSVETMMRELAVKSGFVDENMNGKAFNPLGPHALRESFGSIMTGQGVPNSLVDFWIGHVIDEMSEAYKTTKFEDAKRMYIEKEAFISVTTNSDLEQKLKAEIDEKNRTLQTLVNGLTTENLDLKSRVAKTELENTDLKRRIMGTEKKLGEIETILKQMVQETEK